ncbi:MAG: YdeI/OmpD-associated family protein [Reichenbachiella sp.]
MTLDFQETVKWGSPVYTINGKNVVGMSAFKSYFGLWFFQGVFLKDDEKKLVNANEKETKGMRQWKFLTFDELDDALILKYLREAISNQKKGKVIKQGKKVLIIPTELQEAFLADPVMKKHFNNFTKYKQQEFCDHIVSAKKMDTKISRIERIKPLILDGIGLNDKYRK